MYGGEVVWGGVGVVWFGANSDAKRGEGEGKVTLFSPPPPPQISNVLSPNPASAPAPSPPPPTPTTKETRYFGSSLLLSQYLIQCMVTGQSGLHTLCALKLAVGSRLDPEHAQIPHLRLMEYRAMVTPKRMLRVPTIVVVSAIIIQFYFFSSSFCLLSFHFVLNLIFSAWKIKQNIFGKKRGDEEK